MNIPNAGDSAAYTAANDTMSQLAGSVGSSIVTATTARAKSVTVSVAGKNATDVAHLLRELRNKGYEANQSGTTINIKWA